MTPSQPLGSEHYLRLRRELRRLKLLCVLATCGLALLGLVATRWLSARRELTVERINFVDPRGTLRLVVSNSERFPLPKTHGRETPRAVRPAGIVFYDARGNEMGGIALSDAQPGRTGALAFDWLNADAMGLVTRVSPDGSRGTAGLEIISRPPPALDPRDAVRATRRRIAVQNDNENAEILLADPQGRDRIRLRVDRQGTARIEVLDADGRVTFSAPGEG